MARYILIDDASGYIWGDTADIDGRNRADIEDPTEAARVLDESLGERGRLYEDVSRLDERSGYRVYRADVRGSEQVPNIIDGQDQEMIEAVERDCEYVTSVAFGADDE
jgi:hypothetical protein